MFETIILTIFCFLIYGKSKCSPQRKQMRAESRCVQRRFQLSGRSVVAFIGVSLIVASTAFGQKEVAAKPDKAAIAKENVRQLLLLMDTDKNGKISKQEWLQFMEAEFNRLDSDKSGELDPKELLQSRFTVKHIRPSDQGK